MRPLALALGVAAGAALAAPALAGAHVVAQPAYLANGKRATITFAAPNERAPHAMTGLTVTAPAGVTLTSPTAPAGWQASITGGRTATWTGGRIAPGRPASFSVDASASTEPGATSFHAVQRYDDGGTVAWTVGFTVLPTPAAAPKQHLLPAVVTAILGLVVIGLLLHRVRGSRRPPLRED